MFNFFLFNFCDLIDFKKFSKPLAYSVFREKLIKKTKQGKCYHDNYNYYFLCVCMSVSNNADTTNVLAVVCTYSYVY